MKKIKDVIRLTGLSRRTLQYYDGEGLMDNRRTAENYRFYGDEDLKRLWRIILFKEMGFQLDEIRELLLADEGNLNVMLRGQVSSIEKEISELKRILEFIEKVISYGLPAINAEIFENEEVTMVDMAKRLSERL